MFLTIHFSINTLLTYKCHVAQNLFSLQHKENVPTNQIEKYVQYIYFIVNMPVSKVI